MDKKLICTMIAVCSGLFFLAGMSTAGELAAVFGQVEKLNIQRQGYVLGGQLTNAQQAIADKNPLEASSQKVFKFKDKTLNIVADKETSRVLVIFEQFEQLSQPQVRELVGQLFLAYEDPTILAHDRLVYWAWGETGKFTEAQFDTAREQKKKLAVIATIKFNSEIRIMDKNTAGARGDVYYIISSDPLLSFFHE